MTPFVVVQIPRIISFDNQKAMEATSTYLIGRLRIFNADVLESFAEFNRMRFVAVAHGASDEDYQDLGLLDLIGFMKDACGVSTEDLYGWAK